MSSFPCFARKLVKRTGFNIEAGVAIVASVLVTSARLKSRLANASGCHALDRAQKKRS